jgi:hypothetical protein
MLLGCPRGMWEARHAEYGVVARRSGLAGVGMCRWRCGAVGVVVVEVDRCKVVVGMVGGSREGIVGLVGTRGFGEVGKACSHCCSCMVVGSIAVVWMGW